VHTPLWQSAAAPHPAPGAHFSVHEPPQSTSLSLPFSTVSEHVGDWQTLPVHTELAQSCGTPQAAPGAHFVVHEPPQSTALSEPLRTPSLQVAA